MRQYSKVLISTLVAVVIAATIVVVASQRTVHETPVNKQENINTTSTTNSALVPRRLPIKPTHTTIPAGYSQYAVSVKFMNDLDIGIGPNGYPIDRSGTALHSNEVISLMETIKNTGGHWSPFSFTLEQEKKNDDLRAEAEKSGRELADMNNYFRLGMPEGVDIIPYIDQLNTFTEVELASPIPEAVPAPAG